MTEIFPQCVNRTIHPYISAEGGVYPCCWIDTKRGVNPHLSPTDHSRLKPFRMENQSIAETLTSPTWHMMQTGLKEYPFKACHRFCSKVARPNNFNATMQPEGQRVATAIHVELSTRCVLQCPKCPRTSYVGDYAVEDLHMDYVNDLATQTVSSTILMCGNYGDPIYHRQFHDVLSVMIENKKIVQVVTNGSGRSRKWWEKTTDIAKDAPLPVEFQFSIDGLEDTNHLYRVGAKWDTIMEALDVCHAAGLMMNWKFIVFKHNQHQIEEARRMARSMNMKFDLIYSSRWDGEDDPMRPNEEFVAK